MSDSGIVKLSKKHEYIFVRDRELFSQVVKSAFAKRRKTISNSMIRFYEQFTKDNVMKALGKSRTNTKKRGAASAVSEMRALKAAIIMYASNIGNNETQLAAFDGTTNDKDLVHVVSLDMEKPSKIILNFTAKYHPNTGSGAKKGRVEIATRAGGDYVSEGVQERLRKNTAPQ